MASKAAMLTENQFGHWEEQEQAAGRILSHESSFTPVLLLHATTARPAKRDPPKVPSDRSGTGTNSKKKALREHLNVKPSSDRLWISHWPLPRMLFFVSPSPRTKISRLLQPVEPKR